MPGIAVPALSIAAAVSRTPNPRAGPFADRERLGVAAHRQIGTDLHAPGAVMRGIKPARRRRCDHAGRPDDGGGIDAAVLEIDAARIATNDTRRRHHLDAL